MAIRSNQPSQPKPSQYPMMVIESEYQGKPTLRITNNEKNYKFDAFNGGASKLSKLFDCDTDGDAVLASAIVFLRKNNAISDNDLRAWFEKFSSQFADILSDNKTPGFKTV